jgi:BlaI family transcriptional regulator, penicillinase repressor
MTHRTPLPRPTPGELEILRVLWQRGSSSVRDVQESLSAGRPTGYTTVLKLLQIMADKGLVTRDDSRRSHQFSARLGQEQTQRQLLEDLLDRAFDGSASQLVMRALAGGHASSEEIADIRRMLDEMERSEA